MQSNEQHLIQFDKNNPAIGPGDPYPFEGKTNPYVELLKNRGYEMDTSKRNFAPAHDIRNSTRIWLNTKNDYGWAQLQ